MQPSTDESDNPHRRVWCALAASQIVAMTIVGCLCTLTQRYLYADGSNFFVQMLRDRKVMDFDPARRFAHLLMEYPAVFVLQVLHCRNPLLVGYAYGLTVVLAPVAGLLLTWWAARKAPVRVWFFPLLSQSIVWLTMSFEPLDIHVAVWLFWCNLYLLSYSKRMSIPIAGLTIALAVMSTCAYEVYLLLAWPLIISAWNCSNRARASRRNGDMVTAWICLLLYLSSFALSLHSALHPRDPGNRSGFLISILAHLAYPPVWYSLLALLCAGWLTRWPEQRPGWRILRAATLTCGLLVVLLPIIGFVGPPLQHMARVQGLYVPLILCGLLWFGQLIRRSDSGFTQWQHENCCWLIALTCFVAVGFQLAATYQWNCYRLQMLSRLAEHRGVVPYEQFDLASPVLERLVQSSDYRSECFNQAKRAPIRYLKQLQLSQFNFGFGWTMPSFCVSLSALNLGSMTTIICAPYDVGWQPFDPRNPNQIPNLIDYGISTNLDLRSQSGDPHPTDPK